MRHYDISDCTVLLSNALSEETFDFVNELFRINMQKWREFVET